MQHLDFWERKTLLTTDAGADLLKLTHGVMAAVPYFQTFSNCMFVDIGSGRIGTQIFLLSKTIYSSQ